MKFTKIIAASIAAVSIMALSSCGTKICDVCHQVPPTRSIESPREADLCDYCYQRIVQTETETDTAHIKATEFSALSDSQKNYIVIFVEERSAYYDAMLGLDFEGDVMETTYAEAAERYSKTVDQIKSIMEAHKQRGATEEK